MFLRALAALTTGLAICAGIAPHADAAVAITEHVDASPASALPAFRLWAPGPGVHQGSSLDGMTPDGGHLYVRTELPLSEDDPAPGLTPERLYDLYGGQARFVMRSGIGAQLVNSTDDGSALVVRTTRSLSPEDVNSYADLYLERGGTFKLISHGQPQANLAALAADGSAAIFFGAENSLDGDSEPGGVQLYDLYRWDEATDTVTLLTPNTPKDVTLGAASSDLSRMVFQTQTDLTGTIGAVSEYGIYELVGDTYVAHGSGNIVAATPDLRLYFNVNRAWSADDTDEDQDGYVWDPTTDSIELLTPDTTTASYIVKVSSDESRWIIGTGDALAPEDANGSNDLYRRSSGGETLYIPHALGLAQATPDLGVLLLQTAESLVPQDTNGFDDVYRLALDDQEPVLITGAQPFTVDRTVFAKAISADGSRVVFSTTEALLLADTDTRRDGYLWTSDGLVLVTPGTTGNTGIGIVSDDLSRLAFGTNEKLVPGDTNVYGDWYIVDFDLTPPVPVIGGPPAFTAQTSAHLTFTTAGDDAAGTSCRIDNGPWSTCPASLDLTGLASGQHRAEMTAWDAVGNATAAPTQRTWTIDLVKPTATAPVVSVPVGVKMTATDVTARITWGGADAGSGIASGRLEQQTDGGAWTVIEAAAAGTSLDRVLKPGHTYRFRVATRDRATNLSAVATGSSFILSAAQEGSASIAYSGRWTASSSSTFMGGRVKSASAAGATATYSFTGRAVSIVSSTGPTRGSVDVLVDGKLKATVKLYASTLTTRKVVYRTSWATAGKHRIQLRVKGTAGHPRVDADAFVVVR